MKIQAVLLRWYKSFNVSYVEYSDRSADAVSRPWNKLTPDGLGEAIYPFIEIPIDDDITTIVGANESGKSHLIGAIKKVLQGEGISSDDGKYSRTDLCHYASIRSKNADLWPNIGLRMLSSADEVSSVIQASGSPQVPQSMGSSDIPLTLILAPDGAETHAFMFIGKDETPLKMSSDQLEAVRRHLPDIECINSDLPISDRIPLLALLAVYGDETYSRVSTFDYAVAQEAANALMKLSIPQKDAKTPEAFTTELTQLQARLGGRQLASSDTGTLELLLFRDVLGIDIGTLRHLANLQERDRGYIEGLIATWNKEIDEVLNLSRYWQQDQAFGLRIDYKQGILYFEITDKTGSIYTFRERSSGLRYFLSYYIQAKALESKRAERGSVILMDEPDSFLSILGQKNLLAVFESLVSPDTSTRNTQLIYTTHSPFLINRNFPRRIRLVRKGDAEEGGIIQVGGV